LGTAKAHRQHGRAIRTVDQRVQELEQQYGEVLQLVRELRERA
jgi:hypothetical protein